MMQIARHQAVCMTDLAKVLVLDKSAVAQNLKPLEREGWVSVVVGANDKRSREVTLTQAGMDKLFEAQSLWEQAQSSFEEGLGVDEASELRRTLARVVTSDYRGDEKLHE